MINWLLFNHIPFLTRLAIQEQHHYQRHWRSIHPSLNWTFMWVYYWIWLSIIESHSSYNNIGSSGATSLSEALKVNSSLTQLGLTMSLKDQLIIIESHSIYNNIGDSGTRSLSEALKVNSSLTQLNLRVILLLNINDWLLSNHILFITILEVQEE